MRREPLCAGCQTKVAGRSFFDMPKFIDKLDPLMVGMCGLMWRRGNLSPERYTVGGSFRGAYWELPNGVYLSCGPLVGKFWCYDPSRDVAVTCSPAWTRDQLEAHLREIIDRVEGSE